MECHYELYSSSLNLWHPKFYAKLILVEVDRNNNFRIFYDAIGIREASGLLEEQTSRISSRFDLKRRKPWTFLKMSPQEEEEEQDV